METQRVGWQCVLADVGQWSISAELNPPRGAEAFQRERKGYWDALLGALSLLFVLFAL